MSHTQPNEVGITFLFFSFFAALVALLWWFGWVPSSVETPAPRENLDELVAVGDLNAPLHFSPFVTPSTSSL